MELITIVTILLGLYSLFVSNWFLFSLTLMASFVYRERAWFVAWLFSGNYTDYPVFARLDIVAAQERVFKLRARLEKIYRDIEKKQKDDSEIQKLQKLRTAFQYEIDYHQKYFEGMIEANIAVLNGKKIRDVRSEFNDKTHGLMAPETNRLPKEERDRWGDITLGELLEVHHQTFGYTD